MSSHPAASPATADARLDELVRRYAGLIRSVVARVGGKAADASRDDIEQQVLINLWRQVSREQTIRHPTSYIYRAAVRETVRALRQILAREQPAGDATDLEPLAVAAETPESQLTGSERGAAIAAAIAGLAPDRRRAVQAHLAGYEVEEIMQMFDWTYQRARNLIARGTADLRHALRDGDLHDH